MPFYGLLPSIAVLVLVTLLVQIIKYLLKPRKAEIPKYQLRPSVLTHSELGAFQALLNSLPDGTHLIIKPRMLDILDPGPNGFQTTGFQRVVQKHFDFVIIEEASGRPLLAVELDDPTHLRPSRQKRDHFVNTICHNTNFPLLRLTNRSPISCELLENAIYRRAA
jgi:hypothetical protein